MNRGRLARTGGDRTNSAIARAARCWSECALHARASLRGQGVRGDLRPLDEIASGRRGSSVVQGLAAFALELRAKGVPVAEIEERITYSAVQLVRAVCGESPLRAA